LRKTNSLTNESLSYVKNYQIIYRKVIQEAKKRYLEKQVIVATNKPKNMWDIINNEIGNTEFMIDNIEIKDGSNLMMNPQSIADKFNAHFIDIINELKIRTELCNVDQGSWNYNTNSFYLAPITEYALVNTIRKLKNLYLMGYDELPENIIKNCGQYLKKPLVHIFNLSFQSGIFPNMLKISKIRPISKGGDERNTSDYRPISILPVFSKILEKIMYKRKNNILSNE
jgi:hypothetical protein